MDSCVVGGKRISFWLCFSSQSRSFLMNVRASTYIYVIYRSPIKKWWTRQVGFLVMDWLERFDSCNLRVDHDMIRVFQPLCLARQEPFLLISLPLTPGGNGRPSIFLHLKSRDRCGIIGQIVGTRAWFPVLERKGPRFELFNMYKHTSRLVDHSSCQ